MAFDQLEQQVETFLGCQIGVELIVGLVGSIKARENLGDALHHTSLSDARRAHQEPARRLERHALPCLRMPIRLETARRVLEFGFQPWAWARRRASAAGCARHPLSFAGKSIEPNPAATSPVTSMTKAASESG